MARKQIAMVCPAGKILDIGCFRGDFLGSLPGSMDKFGIEPSDEAAAVARSRNVTIVAPTVEAVPDSTSGFDIVTMFDVVEHLTTPYDSLIKVSLLLKPGGWLLVSTGNTDAMTWRLMRRHYWYYFPEHLMFYNPGWFSWFAGKANMTLDSVMGYAHKVAPASQRLGEFGAAVRFCILQKLIAACPILSQNAFPLTHWRVRRWVRPPICNHSIDHMLVVLRKNP